MDTLQWAILIIGGLFTLGLIVAGVVISRGQTSVLQERLGRYAETTIQVAPSPEAAPQQRQSPLGERLNELLRNRSFFSKVQNDLNSADIKINVGEFFAFTAIVVIAGGFLGAMFAVFPTCGLDIVCVIENRLSAGIFAIVGAIAGFFVPRVYVGFRKGQRLKAFDNQLGDTLNLLVNALRSGYSVLQAMEAVAKELPPPISVEFRRVVQEIQLGLPMETALDHLLGRIASEDLDLVVTAINIQREVGGNLAEILDVISHTIRERVRIKGEIATLTAQGMATGYAITAMPFALMGLLAIVNRPYISEFFKAENNRPPVCCGYLMLIVGLIMITIGGFIIKKIVDIEV
jgi:tight adherence protein B